MGPLLGGAGESTRVHGQHCPPLSDICDHNGHHWDENLPLCIAASYRSALYRPLLCSDYVSLVLCSSPVLLSCSAPTCPLYAVLRPLCWCVPLLCPLLCSVFCVAVLSTTCFLCSVLLCSVLCDVVLSSTCFLCSVLLCSASTCLLSRPRPSVPTR